MIVPFQCGGIRVQPMSSKTEYTVRAYDRDTFTYNDALRVAEVMLDAFAFDDLHPYIWGPRYSKFSDPIELWKATGSPMHKLVGYHQRVADYNFTLNMYARFFHNIVLKPNETVYGVYDNNDELVAMGNWMMPPDIPVPESLWARLRRLYYKAKYIIVDVLLMLRHEHPATTPRIENVNKTVGPWFERIPWTRDTKEQFASKTHAELKDTEYPSSSLSMVRFVAVTHAAQRKGVGNLLLTAMMADMPHNIPFRSDDGSKTAVGPGKNFLFASTPGKSLYLKMGYKLLETRHIAENGKTMATVHLMHH